MSTTAEPTANEPTLSVVIPVYNDPDGIRLTLESLTGQTWPTDECEILAVDNGSTDSTRDVIETYCERYPDLVTLLVEDEIQGSYAARNEGVRNARGSLIAFIDADMTVDAEWAESVVASFEEHGWDYMGCAIEVYTDGPESLGSKYDRLLAGFPVEQYIEEHQFTVTACLTVRRALFDAVGPFDGRITSHGDKEFGKRVHAAGFDQHFEPSITVYHPARETAGAWLKKQFRIGRGAVQHRQYHPEHGEGSHPFHPRKFLPPRPGYFLERLADTTDPTVREATVLYAFDYASKLARAAGGLYERYVSTRT
jgi:glycosyltransferase involved in cell wall biosynthesis